MPRMGFNRKRKRGENVSYFPSQIRTVLRLCKEKMVPFEVMKKSGLHRKKSRQA